MLTRIKTATRRRPVRVAMRLALGLALAAGAATGPAWALDDPAPLPWRTKATSIHAPYASMECTLCHVKRSGGPLHDATDQLCLPCHEDARRHVHAPRKCTRCHNAHASKRAKLLRANLEKCTECHDKK